MARQLETIGAFAKWREGELDDVEAIEQIFAKRAGGHRGFEVAIGRGHDPGRRRCGFSNRPPVRIFAPGGTARAWAEAGGGSSPTSSRKSVPPSAAGHLAGDVANRAREGASGVVRRGRFRAIRRSGWGQLTVTNGPAAAAAPGVHRMSQNTFTGAVFAAEQNRRPRSEQRVW